MTRRKGLMWVLIGIIALAVAVPLAWETRAEGDVAAMASPPRGRGAVSSGLAAASRTEMARAWHAVQTALPLGGGNAALHDLIGGNFAIADVADPAGAAVSLDRPRIAYNSHSGEYLVVWQGYVSGTGYNIYGRRISAGGAPVDDAFVVSAAPGTQAHPAVAGAGNGYWMTWVDGRSGQWQLYLQQLADTGTPAGPEILVATAPANLNLPRIACGNGHCLVVWTEFTDEVATVFVRGYDASGNPLGERQHLTSEAGFAVDPDIAFNRLDNHFLVVWSDWSGVTYMDIRAQRLSDACAPLGAPILLTSAPLNQRMPTVAFNAASERYAVVWQDGRDGVQWDLKGQLVGRDGSLVGSTLSVFSGPFDDIDPAIAAHDTASQFVVTFEREVNASGLPEIAACAISGAGIASTPFRVRQWHNLRSSPTIVHRSSSSEYAVAWVDEYTGSEADILAQRISDAGTLAGAMIQVSIGCKGQEWPAIAFGERQRRYLAVWQDFRSGSDYEIYGQLLAADGSRIGGDLATATNGDLHGDPDVAYSPARDEFLVVWQEIRSAQAGYDIYARRISGAGQLVGDTILISARTNASNEGHPNVVYNATQQQYLITWHAFTDNSWDIWSQRLSDAGQMIGQNARLSHSQSNEFYPKAVHHDARDQYAVIWTDTRAGATASAFAQRLNAAAEPLPADIAVITPTVELLGYDISCHQAADEYLIAWGDRNAGVRARRLTAALRPVDVPTTLSQFTDARYPALSYDPETAEHLCAWQEPNAAQEWDIGGQRVARDGLPVGAHITLSAAPDMQIAAVIARNGVSGEHLVAWQDFRHQTWDIYGQRWIHPMLVGGLNRAYLPAILKP